MPHDDIPNMFGRGVESHCDGYFILCYEIYKLDILFGNNLI